ncbi:MAG: type II CAAX endopeptidase family protein [bacterium]|nr:type II CAAX endopeptidase family protein [bacterium]
MNGIEPIRPTRQVSMLVFVLAHFALAALVNLVFFAGNTFMPLASATGGLFTGSLIVNVILVAALIWLLIGRIGGLRPYDVGLIARDVPMGAAFGVGLWIAAQIIHAGFGLLYHGAITLHPRWDATSGALIGWLLAQIFGSAVFEEIAYRGFLFPQLYLRLTRFADRPGQRLAWAILLSQMVFAFSHIPNRIYLGMTPFEIGIDLVALFGWGVLYTLIYLRTGNLFIVIGVHALGNAPTTLFATAPLFDGSGASFLIYILALVTLFLIPLWRAHLRAVNAGKLPHITADDVLEADGRRAADTASVL